MEMTPQQALGFYMANIRILLITSYSKAKIICDNRCIVAVLPISSETTKFYRTIY